jgi:hypothetical protein
MSAATLLARLQQAGVRVTLVGEQLGIDAPEGVLTPDVLAELRAAKPELIALLAGPVVACLDCRDTHPGPRACDGRPFRVGVVISDSPALWMRAIHCPRCCPARDPDAPSPRRESAPQPRPEDPDPAPWHWPESEGGEA